MQNLTFLNLLFAVSMISVLTGCALEGQAQNKSIASKTERFSSKVSEHTFKILMGEFYINERKNALAAEYFLEVALESNDPYIAERATKTAVFAGNIDKALVAARRWKQLDHSSSKAQQYITLLLLHKERFSEAADELRNLEVQINQENERAPLSERKVARSGHAIIIEMLKRDSNPGKVYETYKIYVERYKNTAEAQFNLSELAMADHRYYDALTAAELASHSSDSIVHDKAKLIYINALSELDRPEDAAKEINRLIKESKNDRMKQIYARLLATVGRETDAIDVLTGVYNNNENNVSALRDMIALHLEQNNLMESEKLTRQLFNYRNQKITAHYFLGRVQEARGLNEAAVGSYFKALETRAYYMDIRSRIVSLLTRLGKVSAAISFLHSEQSKSLNKSDLVNLYQMESELLERSGRLEDALAVIQKASGVLPAYSEELQYSSALIHEQLGRFDEAERLLKSVLELNENSSAALNALGYMLVENTTRYDEALQYIEKAYKIRPDDPAIVDSLGWVHFHKGNYRLAEEYLKVAYRELKDPEVAGHLIEVLTKKGNVKAAKAVYSEMIQRHPDDDVLKKVKDKIIGMHAD